MGRGSLDSPKIRKLIDLMADPTNALTQREMADALGVSRRTIRRWKGMPGFADSLYTQLVQQTGADIHLVFKALMRQAVTGDVRAAKMLLDLVGRLSPGGFAGQEPQTLQEWVEAVAREERTDEQESAGAGSGKS